MITNNNYNVDLAKLSDENYCFAKEIYFDAKAQGIKSTRDKSLIRLIKSKAILASGFPTILLPVNPNRLYDRTNNLLQKKQIGNFSTTFLMKKSLL